MNIQIGSMYSPRNKIIKNYVFNYDLDGCIKEPSSVINPSILIEAPLDLISGCNYMYIGAFNRYYIINDIKSATNTTCTVSATCDVLMSYKDDLLNCAGYIERNEDVVSFLLADSDRLRQVNPAISTVPFTVPTEAEGYTYCLITTRAVPPSP